MNEILKRSKQIEERCYVHGLNTVKMLILSKIPHAFNIVPIKVPAKMFIETNNLILNFIGKGKGLRRVKQFCSKTY
jgi:hypothetical protein